MKNHTVQVGVSAKRGDNQRAVFLVRQSHPYPDTEGVCGSLRWRNGGGIFPEYGRRAEGIGAEFVFELLRSDISPDDLPRDYNRRHLAGYEGGPGALVYRGNSLGEMSIRWRSGSDYPEIKVRGFDSPTSGERAWIMSEIFPAITSYVESNRPGLYAEAVDGVQTRLDLHLRELSARLEVLRAEAAQAVKLLRAAGMS